LCQWIISESRNPVISESQSPILLDIGTGSGCIAITLAAELAGTKVCAWDISAQALKIARKNAERLHVSIDFQQVDVFQVKEGTDLYSLIVSNPPYICQQERTEMEQNVLNYEPETALFVPDDNPLLFYRAIARYATSALKDGGWLYFEINPLYADDIREMLCSMQFSNIDIKKDQYGKQRMIRAQR
jgi:release factor glutamine methyltransferase